MLRIPGSRTFVHPVEDLIQVAFSVAVLVFLPHGAVFTPQHHELAVPTALGGEVGDLHDDRAGGTGDSGEGPGRRCACRVGGSHGLSREE